VSWETYEHEADVGVRGVGASPGEAFAEAALALTSCVLEPGELEERESVEVSCEAPDLELLLCDWLNALIWQTSVEGLLVARARVQVEGGDGDWRLSGRAWGERVDRERHRPAVEPKGATFTTLRVERLEDGRWLAQTVIDI
jgi:SHS2 domain-containing protein